MVHLAVPTSIHFHFAKGFLHPNTRIDVRLLGPCFKTGHLKPLCQHPRQSAVLNHSRQHYTQDYNTPRKELPFLGLFPVTMTDVDSLATECILKNQDWSAASVSGYKCFPFNNFTYYLTLCSEFFSSFDHSTCALSVSCQYLALDGIYHPFRAAFPNNSTYWRRFT